MKKAKFVKEITVVDPLSNEDVSISVYQHEGGGMFAIDSSYLDQNFEDDTYPIVPDPFSNKFEPQLVMLQD